MQSFKTKDETGWCESSLLWIWFCN
jgi:hypothetical protein